MHMCVRARTCMYVCMHVCVYIYMCVYVCVCVNIFGTRKGMGTNIGSIDRYDTTSERSPPPQIKTKKSPANHQIQPLPPPTPPKKHNKRRTWCCWRSCTSTASTVKSRRPFACSPTASPWESWVRGRGGEGALMETGGGESTYTMQAARPPRGWVGPRTHAHIYTHTHVCVYMGYTYIHAHAHAFTQCTCTCIHTYTAPSSDFD